jgi:hypothetical protein
MAKARKEYRSPVIKEWGTVSELTAAVGGDAVQGSGTPGGTVG